MTAPESGEMVRHRVVLWGSSSLLSICQVPARAAPAAGGEVIKVPKAQWTRSKERVLVLALTVALIAEVTVAVLVLRQL